MNHLLAEKYLYGVYSIKHNNVIAVYENEIDAREIVNKLQKINFHYVKTIPFNPIYEDTSLSEENINPYNKSNEILEPTQEGIYGVSNIEKSIYSISNKVRKRISPKKIKNN